MPNNRDDFTQKTIDRMAKRVGYRCSNPNCRKLTCGAAVNPEDYVNIGVAAHIRAAAPGGKRYDPKMTASQRKSILNGIWLCQTCSKLVDSDELRYTVELLYQWKYDAETESVKQLENQPVVGTNLAAAYGELKENPNYRESVRFLQRMNEEINELLSKMEEIQQKLDIARVEDNRFWEQAYEERLHSMMSLYENMNNQLAVMAYEGRRVERYVREINTYAEKSPLSASRSHSHMVSNRKHKYFDDRADTEINRLIPYMEDMRRGIDWLTAEVTNLHLKRIVNERTLLKVDCMIGPMTVQEK